MSRNMSAAKKGVRHSQESIDKMKVVASKRIRREDGCFVKG